MDIKWLIFAFFLLHCQAPTGAMVWNPCTDECWCVKEDGDDNMTTINCDLKQNWTKWPTDLPENHQFQTVVTLNLSCINTTYKISTKKDLFASFSRLSKLKVYGCFNELVDGMFVRSNITNSLEELKIVQSPIKSLAPGMFKGLSDLKKLNLGYNQIAEIKPGTFVGLENLQTLHLIYNQLQRIDISAFEGLSNKGQIELMGNPLICDCYFEPIWTLTYLHSPWNGNNECSHFPKNSLSGLKWKDLTLESLKKTCQVTTEATSPTTTTKKTNTTTTSTISTTTKITNATTNTTSTTPKVVTTKPKQTTEVIDSTTRIMKKKVKELRLSRLVFVLLLAIVGFICGRSLRWLYFNKKFTRKFWSRLKLALKRLLLMKSKRHESSDSGETSGSSDSSESQSSGSSSGSSSDETTDTT